MTQPTTIQDSALVSYGLLAGGVRAFVPPILDLPFVRAVRGAMFDRLARVAGVTLSSEARRVLIDLEQPTIGRGMAEQAIRWAAGRFLPGAPVIDGVRNVLRTYAAGVLFRKYLETHRSTPRDPVMTAIEAERVRDALRSSIDISSLEHLKAIAAMTVSGVKNIDQTAEISVVQRYSDAFVSAVAELPMTWIEVLDQDFAKTLSEKNPTG